MCGIVGAISGRGPLDEAEFTAMRDTLAHRGPEGAASAWFEDRHVALGHRRLSFLDLSAAGGQPLCNATGSAWIVYNGEIYNHVELRRILEAEGHVFRTRTDTEVILHGYEQWGERVVDRLKGMFAFGILDLGRKRLFLARDRFGIKPLYYLHTPSHFIFASELKALIRSRDVARQPDPSAMADYLIYRYVPSPKTIWQGIRKLPPAHVLTFDYREFQAETREYWCLGFAEQGTDSRSLAEGTGRRLRESVACHARCDVEVGALLSGGYDSSAVVYWMTCAGYRPPTFSIGFEGWEQSEHVFAKLVADGLGLPSHHTVADDSALGLLDLMPDVFDEPIADISILPTWLVCRDAAKQVKAVMSGDGADELFGGYWWQKEAFALDAKHSTRSWPDRLLRREPPSATDWVEFYAEAMAMGRFDRAELEAAFHPGHHGDLPDDPEWFYRRHFDHRLSPLKCIQRLDIKCFMAELVLTKVDRASMSNSLEVRVPFLDHELYQEVLGMREECYFRSGVPKFLLHENIKGHLPHAILGRPKQGFVGPETFYKNLTPYHEILDDSALASAGIIRDAYIRELFSKADCWRLWKLAVLEKWYRRWVS
jgi:asparagine synthase (glutamine-hydrolysing)